MSKSLQERRRELEKELERIRYQEAFSRSRQDKKTPNLSKVFSEIESIHDDPRKKNAFSNYMDVFGTPPPHSEETFVFFDNSNSLGVTKYGEPGELYKCKYVVKRDGKIHFLISTMKEVRNEVREVDIDLQDPSIPKKEAEKYARIYDRCWENFSQYAKERISDNKRLHEKLSLSFFSPSSMRKAYDPFLRLEKFDSLEKLNGMLPLYEKESDFKNAKEGKGLLKFMHYIDKNGAVWHNAKTKNDIKNSTKKERHNFHTRVSSIGVDTKNPSNQAIDFSNEFHDENYNAEHRLGFVRARPDTIDQDLLQEYLEEIEDYIPSPSPQDQEIVIKTNYEAYREENGFTKIVFNISYINIDGTEFSYIEKPGQGNTKIAQGDQVIFQASRDLSEDEIDRILESMGPTRLKTILPAGLNVEYKRGGATIDFPQEYQYLQNRSISQFPSSTFNAPWQNQATQEKTLVI